MHRNVLILNKAKLVAQGYIAFRIASQMGSGQMKYTIKGLRCHLGRKQRLAFTFNDCHGIIITEQIPEAVIVSFLATMISPVRYLTWMRSNQLCVCACVCVYSFVCVDTHSSFSPSSQQVLLCTTTQSGAGLDHQPSPHTSLSNTHTCTLGLGIARDLTIRCYHYISVCVCGCLSLGRQGPLNNTV
uniref:Uncharacterized protein n=1 Tax=Oncorhynchus kisutch TaxID=8019 RepID=A0A8C7LH39_ONCKI